MFRTHILLVLVIGFLLLYSWSRGTWIIIEFHADKLNLNHRLISVIEYLRAELE